MLGEYSDMQNTPLCMQNMPVVLELDKASANAVRSPLYAMQHWLLCSPVYPKAVDNL